MDVRKLSNKDTASGFYPTPAELAGKMLEKADLSAVSFILEPSAGKGNLAVEAMKAMNSWNGDRWQIDLVEKDADLRAILERKFTYQGMKESFPELFREYDRMDADRRHVHGDEKLLDRYYRLQEETGRLEHTENVHVVHDDFLTYTPKFRYDLILMNPPFREGAGHLIHAIRLIQRGGGQIVCLLNRETLVNPCTNERKELAALLRRYDAETEFMGNAFHDAERGTDVSVAMVYIDIPRPEPESMIWEKLQEAEKEYREEMPESEEVISSDPVDAAIAMYNVEAEASQALIREYEALTGRFLLKDGEGQILSMYVEECGQNRRDPEINSFMKALRMKYWRALMENPAFTGKLTSSLRSKYHDMVQKLADYEFSRFNIDRIHTEMMAELTQGAKEAIMELFEKFTVSHCYSRDVESGNVHYFNGWKTNKAWKVGKKVIIPTYGLYSDWRGKFDTYSTYALLSDMEKALNYLDGNMTRDVNLDYQLRTYLEAGQNRNIPLKYFSISLYKKGTAHITFTNQELMDRFNIFAAQQKGWLPPSYGRREYADMDSEEKNVIDSFQGEEAYAQVMADPGRYLSTDDQLLLAVSE